MKKALYYISYLLTVLPVTLQAQKVPTLYDLDLYITDKNDTLAFVSLSDNYMLSEHSDSLAITNLEGIEQNDAQYLRLDGIYRKRFLNKLNITETDTVYIYDYAVNRLSSFPVNSVRVVACLSMYGADWPYTQYDYMIGFEVNRQQLQSTDLYFNYNIIAIGRTNPFIAGMLKPITWEKTAAKSFSWRLSNQEYTALQQLTKGNVYNSKAGNLQYFIQEYVQDSYVVARHLVVIDIQTKIVVCERFYRDGESASQAPLNSVDEGFHQWTGALFKGMPPVIFGFEYYSFGCPPITFLKPDESDIYINCDNRH